MVARASDGDCADGGLAVFIVLSFALVIVGPQVADWA